MNRSCALLGLSILAVLALPSGAAAQEEGPANPYLPLVPGETSWRFDQGVFSASRADSVLRRTMKDMVSFDAAVGLGLGTLTWSAQKGGDGKVLIREVFDPADPDTPEAVNTWEVTQKDAGGGVILTVLTARLLDESQYHVVLCPVAPTEGLTWYWNTSTGQIWLDYEPTPPSEEGGEIQAPNARGTVKKLNVSVSDNRLRAHDCVEIELQLYSSTDRDGELQDDSILKQTWWLSRDYGVLRWGGDNADQNRDTAAIEDTTTEPPSSHPLDSFVVFR